MVTEKPRAQRVVEDDDGPFTGRSLDAQTCAVGFDFFANQQAGVAALRLDDHRLHQRNSSGAKGRELTAFERTQPLEQCAPGQTGAAGRERERERVEHPSRGRTVDSVDGLRFGPAEDSLREDRFDQLRKTTAHFRSAFWESAVRSRRSARCAGAWAGGQPAWPSKATKPSTELSPQAFATALWTACCGKWFGNSAWE